MSSKSDDNELNKGLNDQEFDEYLRRESEVSQAYRELPSRGVPLALEQRVLHQAQTRTARKSAAPRWLHWGAPIAVAASALLTVAVLLRTTPQDTALQAPAARPTAEPPAMQSPAMESNDAPVAAQSERSLLESDELRDAAPAPRLNAPSPSGPARARSSDSTAQLPEPAPPPAPVAAPRRDVKAESPGQESLSRSAGDDKAKTSAGAAQSAPAAAEEREQYAGGASRNYATEERRAAPEAKRAEEAPAAEKQAKKRVEIPPATAPTSAIQTVTRVAPPQPPDPQVAADRKIAPETLLKQVRQLRAQGKAAEADALVKRLRAAYPDFSVPPEDLPQ